MVMRASDAPFAILVCLAAGLCASLLFLRPPLAAEPKIGTPAAAKRPAGDSAIAPQERAIRPVAEEICKAFGSARPASTPSLDRVAPPRATPTADWLRPIGALEDMGGLSWLFFKDERRGGVIKLRADGTETSDGRLIEHSAREGIVELEAQRYSYRGK